MRKSIPAVLALVSSVAMSLLAVPASASAVPSVQIASQPAAAVKSAAVQAAVVAAPPFSDVPSTSQFAADISWLAGVGVTTGFADNSFRPLQTVDRQSMAAFLFRLANPSKPDPTCTVAPFTDVPLTHPFCGVISWAKTAGIVTGYTDGSYRPGLAVSREAAAAFLFRAAGLAATAEPCTTAPFPDVSISSSLCPAIAWAAGAGVVNGFADGTYRPAAPIQRQAIAALFHRFDDKLFIPSTLDGEVGSTQGLDGYYPEAGNGGHDVTSYDLNLTYTPTTKTIVASATIVSKVTSAGKLGRFNLDLENELTVSSVEVNDRSASFTHADRELTITPKGGLPAGSTFTVIVNYSGVPTYVDDIYGDSGWHQLAGGVAVVAGEPAASSAWFPSNASPVDRAYFAVTATVPTDWKVIANGNPVTTGLPTPPAGWETFSWKATEPMATYLATIYIDKFETETGVTSGGIPIINAYAPGTIAATKTNAARTGEILDFLADKFGPYPFDTIGGIYLNGSIGYSLETQTRPVYSVGRTGASLLTIVHEIAHQWYGDDVTLSKWQDICLNECLAAYSEWMWAEAKPVGTAPVVNLDARYRTTVTTNLNRPTYWAQKLVDMGAGHEFDSPVYARGALAIHALRRELGESAFNTLLKRWAAEKSDTNVNFTDFEALVTNVAGRDLQPFMNAWFHSTVIPANQYLYPGTLATT